MKFWEGEGYRKYFLRYFLLQLDEMGGTTLGAIAIAESGYRNLSGRIIQTFTDDFAFSIRVIRKDEDVMNRHLTMGGQMVDVPVNDLLAFPVALQSFGQPPAGPARIEEPAGGNGYFSMISCCYFEVFVNFQDQRICPH